MKKGWGKNKFIKCGVLLYFLVEFFVFFLMAGKCNLVGPLKRSVLFYLFCC